MRRKIAILKRAVKLAFFSLVMLTTISSAIAQSITVKGKVTAADGTPLIGASVTIPKKNIATITDLEGNYMIKADIGDIVRCSYLGYKTVEKEVQSNTLDFVLEEDLLKLDEVVITGTSGLTTKKELGSTINSVNGDELEDAPVSSVTEALQGRIAGAQIMRNSGSPASSISIRLRGPSTILGSSDPLIMIDGVIVNGDPRSAVSLGSYTQNPLADIDMNDIENIEILKGASAAALYGSLASNGIIHIITKKGKSGKPRISFSTGVNFNSVPKYKPYNDVNLKWVKDENGNYVTAETKRYNYQEYIFDDESKGFENHISLAGGSSTTTYNIAGSWLYNEGILRNMDFDRKTLRIRMNQVITDWFSISAGNYAAFSSSRDIPFGNAWTGNPMVALLFADNSLDPSPDEFGNYPYIGWMSNPYEDIDRLDITQNHIRTISDVQLNAHFSNGLNLKYVLGYDVTNSNGKFKIPFGFTMDKFGDLKKYRSHYTILNSNFDASYEFDITSDIKSVTGAGYSYQKKNYEGFNARNDKISEFENIDILSGDGTVGNYLKEISYWGGYIQQHFKFYDKLFLTLAGRMDGASTFGKDQRQQFYPKVSVSYSISDEDFFKNSLGSIFNSFVIRSAWGQAGNLTALDRNPYGIYNNYSVGSYNGQSSYRPSSISGNAELKPERQTEFEFGFDMSMLSNKLGLEFTYYNQEVYDLLLNRNLSPSTGYSTRYENIGNMTNKGVEIALKATVMETKDFSWDLRASYSKNDNKVTHVEGGRISLGGFGTSIAQTDQPLGVFYGYFFARDKNGNLVLDENGFPQRAQGHYEIKTLSDGEKITVAVQDFDENGQPKGEKLKKILGDPNPDYLASLTSEFKYKGFAFRMHFDAVQGFDVMDWDKRIALKYPGGYFYGQELAGKKPKEYYRSQYYIYEGFVEDGSFIKLRELSLSYLLKLNKDYLKSVKFVLSGSNLINITNYWGYDPEVNFEGASNGARAQDFGNIPVPKVYKLGLKFNF